MAIYMKVNIRTGSFVEKVDIFGQMDLFTLGNSLMGKDKVLVNGDQVLLMVIFMKASIKRIRKRGRENIHGIKDVYLMVILLGI
jgi:hypothetical protein